MTTESILIIRVVTNFISVNKHNYSVDLNKKKTVRKSFYVEKNMEIRMKFCGSSVTSCHVMLHQTCRFTLYFCNLKLNPHISLSHPPIKIQES